MNIIKILVTALFLSTLMVACDSPSTNKGSPTAQHPDSVELARAKITDYAEDSTKNSAPTVEDYKQAGITGVTDENISLVNKKVESLTGEEANTVQKIQEIVTSVVAGSNQTTGSATLEISFIKAIVVTSTSAKINWKLNQNATGQVEYGETVAYGLFNTKEKSYNYHEHTQPLINLKSNTLYHYRVISKDEKGNEVVSEDFTFKTEVYPILRTVLAST